MGRYFGREPRYSRQEIEAQAKEAIEARVGMGRPPEEEWAPVNARLAELDRELATRTRHDPEPVLASQPQPQSQPEPQPEPAPASAGPEWRSS